MEVKVEENGSYPTMVFSGRLDLYNAPMAREQFKKIFESGSKQFVIDLSNMDMIDSAGLGVLINELKRFLDSGGEFVLCGLSDSIQSLFAITRYDAFFKIFDSVKSAQRYLKDTYSK